MNGPIPHSPYTPSQVPLASDKFEKSKGSFLLGLILPFVIFAIGYSAVVLLMILTDKFIHPSLGGQITSSTFLLVLPIVALIWSIIYFLCRGKSRTVAGMMTGNGLILAFVGYVIFIEWPRYRAKLHHPSYIGQPVDEITTKLPLTLLVQKYRGL